MNSNIDHAILLFQEYKLDEAQVEFESILEEDANHIDALVYLGRIHSRTQNYGVSLNCFNRVIELDETNSVALTGIQLIKNILQLTNNFYFENSYTDDDLYE